MEAGYLPITRGGGGGGGQKGTGDEGGGIRNEDWGDGDVWGVGDGGRGHEQQGTGNDADADNTAVTNQQIA